MTHILISSRHADTRTICDRIHDRLVKTFGEDNVAQDVFDIAIEMDFRSAIREAVARCDVLLVLIGPQWVTITSSNGKRRLTNPADFVRMEVERGLQRANCAVIPVLVGGASMPGPDDLPDTLRELAYRDVVEVRDDPEFCADMNHLVKELRKPD